MPHCVCVVVVQVTKLQSNVVALIKGVKHLVRIVSFLITIASISWPLATLAALLIPTAFGVAVMRGKRIERVQDKLQDQETQFETVLSEGIQAVATRKVLGTHSHKCLPPHSPLHLRTLLTVACVCLSV